MMCIDCSDGRTIILVGGQNVLQAAEIAQKEHGRLRLVITPLCSTTNMMEGCVELGDWREQKEQP